MRLDVQEIKNIIKTDNFSINELEQIDGWKESGIGT